MAGDMHVPKDAPACLRFGDPRKLPIRSPWSYDGGACCPLFLTEKDGAIALDHTPGCTSQGVCARARRSRDLREGKYPPHPTVKTRDTWQYRVRMWLAELARRVGRRAAA